MFCTNCGKQIQEVAKFCQFCGAKNELPSQEARDSSIESASVEVEASSTEAPSERNAAVVPESAEVHANHAYQKPIEMKPVGPAWLRWLWYLVVFSLFNVVGRWFADALFDSGVINGFVAVAVGGLAAWGACLIWQRIEGAGRKLLVGCGIVAAAFVLAITAKALGDFMRPKASAQMARQSVSVAAASPVQETAFGEQMRPTPIIQHHSVQECFAEYSFGSIKNYQLIREWCQSALDVSKHPVARMRYSCYLEGTKIELYGSHIEEFARKVSLPCDDKNPLPVCPTSKKFNLENMRCEVECDKFHGYAPDRTGQACYLACPNNEWPLYTRAVMGCSSANGIGSYYPSP